MKTQLNADTAAPLHKTHAIQLHFNDTPNDQALYAALCACCDQDSRTLRLQIMYQLTVAMGLMMPDSFLREYAANAAAAYVPPPPTQPPTTLRLIPGGRDNQERTRTHDNNSRKQPCLRNGSSPSQDAPRHLLFRPRFERWKTFPLICANRSSCSKGYVAPWVSLPMLMKTSKGSQ